MTTAINIAAGISACVMAVCGAPLSLFSLANHDAPTALVGLIIIVSAGAVGVLIKLHP